VYKLFSLVILYLAQTDNNGEQTRRPFDVRNFSTTHDTTTETTTTTRLFVNDVTLRPPRKLLTSLVGLSTMGRAVNTTKYHQTEPPVFNTTLSPSRKGFRTILREAENTVGSPPPRQDSNYRRMTTTTRPTTTGPHRTRNKTLDSQPQKFGVRNDIRKGN